MSVQASAWAWDLKGLPQHLKLTLLAIADACNSQGYGFPGQTHLAELVGCSDRQIRNNITQLQDLGLIETTHRPGDGSGRRTNHYQLAMSKPVDNLLTTCGQRGKHRKSSVGATGSPEQGQPEVEGGGNRKSSVGQPEQIVSGEPLVLTVSKNQEHTLCAPRTAGGDNNVSSPGFEKFWDAWPAGHRKRGKRAALAIWKTHHLEPKSAMIIADVLTRAERDGQWHRGYAPMPQTYLRGARWEDELEAPPERPRKDNITASIAALEELAR